MNDFYHIIYNPYANRGGAKRYLDAFVSLLDTRGESYAVHETTTPGHATLITREIISRGAKYIIIMGGDGTVQEVVNGYTEGDDVVFGIIPAGTGNDVSKMLKIPPALEDVGAVAAIIFEKKIKPVDLIVAADGTQSVLFYSFGIAASMIVDMQRYKKKNKMSYHKALIKNLFVFKPGEYEVILDGPSRRYKADFCAVHNCIHAGSGMSLIKDAVIDDGLVELLIVENKGFFRRVSNFISIIRKTIHLQPNVQILPIKDVTINSAEGELCCVAGEIYEVKQLKLSVRHRAIRMFHG